MIRAEESKGEVTESGVVCAEVTGTNKNKHQFNLVIHILLECAFLTLRAETEPRPRVAENLLAKAQTKAHTSLNRLTFLFFTACKWSQPLKRAIQNAVWSFIYAVLTFCRTLLGCSLSYFFLIIPVAYHERTKKSAFERWKKHTIWFIMLHSISNEILLTNE